MAEDTIIIRNAEATDVIFEHDQLGMFNVSRALAIVAAAQSVPAAERPEWARARAFRFNPDFVAYLERSTTPERYQAITRKRAMRAGVGVVTPTETMLLLDGHHRALWRHRHGFASHFAIVLPVAYYAALQVIITVTPSGRA